jgi:hypothetical protein
MKLKEAISIITEKEKGFMVSFEKRTGGILASDHFPDKHAGEDLIATEKYAWELAERFAKATDDTYVNIYVVDNNFSPVIGYEEKKLKSYNIL